MSYRMHHLAARDMSAAEQRQAREWVASDQIAKALQTDASTPPADAAEPVYAIVGGVEVDIASPAYAAWYQHYYDSDGW